MFRIILLLLSILYLNLFLSQSADKGKINLYLGAGAGLYGVLSNQNVGHNSAALPIKLNLDVSYFTHKQVSLGFEFLNQTFLNDEDPSTIKTVSSGMLGININCHIINRKKSNIFIGTSVGSFDFDFDYSVIDSTRGSIGGNGELLASGIYNTFYIGLNKYFFAKRIGIRIKSGFINQSMQMNSLTINGNDHTSLGKKELEDWRIAMLGGFLDFGLVIRIK